MQLLIIQKNILYLHISKSDKNSNKRKSQIVFSHNKIQNISHIINPIFQFLKKKKQFNIIYCTNIGSRDNSAKT